MNQQDVTIAVPVRVVRIGSYSYSTIINGVTFSSEGIFTRTGNQIIYLSPSAGSPTVSTGTFTGSLTISPTISGPVTCHGIRVSFVSRAQSTLKIVNISGTNYNTGLISGCGSYSSSTAAGKIGNWLRGGASPVSGTSIGSALSYSGTLAIEIVCVKPSSVTELADALETASIVYMSGRRSSESNNSAIAMVKDWVEAGKGVFIDQGDEVSELPFANAIGYHIEAGSPQTTTVYDNRLPQVLVSPVGYTIPYVTPNEIPSQGSNGAYISSSQIGTVTFGVGRTHENRKFMVANVDNNSGVFIFGDKYFNNNDSETIKLMTNIFAWALHNVPVYE